VNEARPRELRREPRQPRRLATEGRLLLAVNDRCSASDTEETVILGRVEAQPHPQRQWFHRLVHTGKHRKVRLMTRWRVAAAACVALQCALPSEH